MSQRHRDALGIQQGACNPSGIARSLVAACDEARNEGKNQREDPAVRLIVHQLAFLCNTSDIDNMDTYEALLSACEREAA